MAPPEKKLDKRYTPVRETSDSDRIGIVKEIFSTITGRYDFLNHFLSMGRDIAWRRFAVGKMAFGKTGRLLDIATGTADLAIMSAIKYPGINVVGLDLVAEMMEVGQKKIAEQNLDNRIGLMQGDALSLPFPDGSFDVAAVAFGIRNIPDRPEALREMKRVVVPGGQVMVLEMTTPRGGFTRALYGFYLNRVLPRLAGLFSRNPGAYLYLADSIMNFPSPVEFAGLMEEAGLEDVTMHKLTMGVTCLHTGIKPG